MEIATLLAAVAALGLPCSNPELRDFPAEQMPWPAAYVRTIEGHNIIALREGTREALIKSDQSFPSLGAIVPAPLHMCRGAGFVRRDNEVGKHMFS
jgi:hypothetical protein